MSDEYFVDRSSLAGMGGSDNAAVKVLKLRVTSHALFKLQKTARSEAINRVKADPRHG